jgi:hypothetical protein
MSPSAIADFTRSSTARNRLAGMRATGYGIAPRGRSALEARPGLEKDSGVAVL